MSHFYHRKLTCGLRPSARSDVEGRDDTKAASDDLEEKEKVFFLHEKGSVEWRAYAGECRSRWQLRIAAAVAGHNSRRNSPAEKTKNLTCVTYTESLEYILHPCGS